MVNSYSSRSNAVILLKALFRQSFAVFYDNPSRVAIDRSEQKARSETQSLSAPAVIEKLQMGVLIHSSDFALEVSEHINKLILSGQFIIYSDFK